MILWFLFLYSRMAIFQQTGYTLRYYKWVKKNYLLSSLPIILTVIISFIIPKITFIFGILGIIYYVIDIMGLKVKFKFTKRGIRLFVTSYLIGLLSYLFSPIILLVDLIILISLYINKPIDNLIEEHYVKELKEKLSNYKGTIIAVGGSYGKTSVKNYLSSILCLESTVLATPKSYNTLMGIAKASKKLDDLYDYFIVEVGASRVGDIKRIMEVINPDISILNNIGNQHLETFKTINNLINEKMLIPKMSGISFVNIDNEHIKNNCTNDMITFGVKEGYYKLTDKKELFVNDKYILDLNYDLKGMYNNYNLIAAISVSHYLGISMQNIKRAVASLKNVDKRYSIKKVGTTTIIDNSYNSNIYAAIENIEMIKKMNGTKCIITPGFVDLGSDEDEYNKRLGKKINECFNIAYIVNNKTIYDVVNKDILYKVDSLNEAIKHFESIKGKKILLIENDLTDFYGGIR